MDNDRRRGSRMALWPAAVAVLAAAGIGGWYFFSDHGASTVDDGGFDVSSTSMARAPAPVSTAVSAPAAAPSSLGMIKGGAEALNAAEGSSAAPAAGPASAPAAAEAPRPKNLQEARQNFIAQARKHEGDVRRWAEQLTAKSPVIRGYGKEWMSYPDLKKLNDDYFKDHDPIKFALGLAKAPNFRTMVAKYAGMPEIQAAVVQGMTKEGPTDLLQAGLDVVRQDPEIKGVVTGVAEKLGLPPGMTAVLASNGAAAADKARAAAELQAR